MALVLLCLSDICFFQRPELREHLALYAQYKITKDKVPPNGHMSTFILYKLSV